MNAPKTPDPPPPAAGEAPSLSVSELTSEQREAAEAALRRAPDALSHVDERFEGVEGRAEFAATAIKVVGSARLELLMLSHQLDRRLYGDDAFRDALKALVLSGRPVRVRILINSPRLAVTQAHRLLELAERASSFIEFRDLAPEQREDFRGEWLIADRRMLLERRDADSLRALLRPDAPVEGRLRGLQFDALWEEATPSQELRRLGI